MVEMRTPKPSPDAHHEVVVSLGQPLGEGIRAVELIQGWQNTLGEECEPDGWAWRGCSGLL